MIRLQNITVSYGEQTVLKNMDLTVPTGGRIALMGPSGCGKTTLLRLIAGLVKPTEGALHVQTDRIAFLFQDPRLLSGRTAAENVNAVLSDRQKTMPEALKWLSAVGLSEAAGKYPHELSGGMQQRVSLARALAYDGNILLLDEPLKGLDEDTKEDMIRLLNTHTAGKTILFATHDREEALRLADTVLQYRGGRFL